MPTVKAVLDQRYKSKDGTYPIIIKARHQNQTPVVQPVGWKIEEKYWKVDRVVKHHEAVVINSKISEYISKAEKYFADCKLNNRHINLSFVFSERTSNSFSGYIKHRAKQHHEKKQLVFGDKLYSIEKLLTECFEREIYFEELNQDLLRDFESFLVKKDNGANTRHWKFSKLRQLFTQAMDDGKAQGPNPFNKYKVVKKPPKKGKKSLSEIDQLESVELAPGPVNDARNMALFSYFCKGSRFENVLTFRRDQIKGDRIHIKTNKGNKFITVKIHSRLRKIIDQYPKGRYLFIKSDPPTDLRKYIKWKDVQNVMINRNLRIACAFAGIKSYVSFHQMRHSFAHHLKQQRTDMHVIKEALGHSKVGTTEGYVDSLGDEEIDVDMNKLYGD